MLAFIASLAAVLAVLFLSRRARASKTRPTTSDLEALECRIAPAALTAKFGAGLLTISGDPAASTVSIVETAGSIEVFDGAASLGVFSGVKSISAKVQGGATITADLAGGGISGSLKVGTTGATTLNVSAGSSVGGTLSFTGDPTAQTLNLGTSVAVGKSLTFNGGSGSDALGIGAGTSIGGSATFTSVEAGTFGNGSAITIAGALSFKNSATPLETNIQTSGGAGLSVGGKLSYAGGRANDSLFLSGTFGGNATYIDASGNNGFGFASGSNVHGSIQMITGAGNDGFSLQSGTVDHSVTLKLGNGNNSFYYGIAGGVTINGNLSIIAGQGDDLWQSSGGGLTLAGNLTVKMGDGTNKLLAGLNVSGTRIAIVTGTGSDQVSLDGNANNAAISILLGAGNDALAGTLLDHPRSALFNGGPGTDHFFENTLTGDPLILVGFEDFT